jgi:hypothetical protein
MASLATSVCLILLGGGAAQACTCELDLFQASETTKVRRARGEASAVFSGRVVELIRPADAHFFRVRFHVDRVWKGSVAAEAIVETGLGSGDCGYSFSKDETYLVYAYSGESGGPLGTNICQRTRLLSAAAADTRALGRGRKPLPMRGKA